jgi:uncharacterized protein (DUF924 family)
MNVRPSDVLDFWFNVAPEEQMELWFGGAPETDQKIRGRFERAVEAAADGKLQDWENEVQSCLALVILLDQFTLNIYRDKARSFEWNARALPVALRALERGFDQQVEPILRVFFYLPLEHAEDLALQKRAVELYRALAEAVPPGEREIFNEFVRYAILHLEVIERFGRFPDRNPILGRKHTPAEAAYMDGGGPPF